ncbi:MAG: DNA methyltransferase [Thermoplasmata archaeon]
MREITDKDYKKFLNTQKKIVIEDTELEIGNYKDIKVLEPNDFKQEVTNVWSFPKRGDWATHSLNAKYRGNWSPQIIRNLILRYSKEGDVVLDPFVGSGTTLIECKLLKRVGIGIDINEDALILTRDRLDFNLLNNHYLEQKTYVGDARNLDLIENESIDLIATHPPYANIISYTKNSNQKVDEDLSKIVSISDFLNEMDKVAKEFYRILKPNKYCAILIGDTRRHKHQIPISFRLMQTFLNQGFILKEDIIKIQHNTTSAPLWAKKSIEYNFLLLMYEHLFIFRKSDIIEKQNETKDSFKWWV